MLKNENIVALATPMGTAALAVLRLSGPDCKSIVQHYLGVSDKVTPGKMLLRNFKTFDKSNILDKLLFCYFENPKSYTGEDSIELYPHGNMILVRRIIEELCKFENTRPAEAGEFTRRAFESGKIDLIQSESVLQMIHATDEYTLDNARKLVDGELSSTLNDLSESIVNLSARMELDVDFAEEEAEPDKEKWQSQIEEMNSYLDTLLDQWELFKNRMQKPRVALLGAPNAGKSSLVNALLKSDRVLVSSQAGTTRDWIEVSLFLKGGEVSLIDTAGLGEHIDELDKRSQEKTLEVAEKSYCKIWLSDGTNENEVIGQDVDLILRTRADLDSFVAKENTLGVSTKSGQGLDEVRTWLEKRFFEKIESSEVWMGTERQAIGVRKAKVCLESCLTYLEQGLLEPEVLAFELRESRIFIQELTGEISEDDILNHLFSEFCIGK
jgi:tRNA modification GTPase